MSISLLSTKTAMELASACLIANPNLDFDMVAKSLYTANVFSYCERYNEDPTQFLSRISNPIQKNVQADFSMFFSARYFMVECLEWSDFETSTAFAYLNHLMRFCLTGSKCLKTDIQENEIIGKVVESTLPHIHSSAYVLEVECDNRGAELYEIGAGGIRKINNTSRYKVAIIDICAEEIKTTYWHAENVTVIDSFLPTLTEDQAGGFNAKLIAKHEAKTRQADIERQERREKEKESMDKLLAVQPDDTQAYIIAELVQDECDHYSDYFATSTDQRIVIGFSKHNRNNFKEMRKAAGQFEQTKALSKADKEAEHRENYSMGAGYYLKDGNRYASGWEVRKVSKGCLSGWQFKVAPHLTGEHSATVNKEANFVLSDLLF